MKRSTNLQNDLRSTAQSMFELIKTVHTDNEDSRLVVIFKMQIPKLQGELYFQMTLSSCQVILNSENTRQ